MVPPISDNAGLSGLCILIVEDEFLIATLIEEDLRSAGCRVIGPFAELAPAMAAFQREPVNIGVLDVNLNGTMSYPLADELMTRNVPLLFLSGYVSTSLPERFRATPRLAKPYDPQKLIREIRRLADRPD